MNRINKNNEDIRQRNKDAVQRSALFWIKLTNDRLSEINKQLLGLATIILPITASVIAIEFLIPKDFEKNLLIIGWVLMFISIVAGGIQILVDARYFLFLSRDSSSREALWSDPNRSIEDIEKEVKSLGTMPSSSTHCPLVIQALAIFSGLFLIMLVAASLLLGR